MTTQTTRFFEIKWICGQSKPYLGLGFDFICSIVSSWFVKSSSSYWSFAKSFCTSSFDMVLGPKSCGPSPTCPFGPWLLGSREPKWGPIEPCLWPSYSLCQGLARKTMEFQQSKNFQRNLIDFFRWNHANPTYNHLVSVFHDYNFVRMKDSRMSVYLNLTSSFQNSFFKIFSLFEKARFSIYYSVFIWFNRKMISGHDFGTWRCLISAPIFIGLPTLSTVFGWFLSLLL